MRYTPVLIGAALIASVAATPAARAQGETGPAGVEAAAVIANPFFADWSAQPYQTPPFASIAVAHYLPAFEAGMAEQLVEMEAIANRRGRATFANTIEAMERSGASLSRVSGVFFNLSGTDSSEELREVERQIAPMLSRHNSAIFLNTRLFARVDSLYQRRDRLRLTEEQQRVLALYHRRFVRAGAGLDAAARTRLADINSALSTLSTQFSQNQLADTAAWTLVLEGEDDLAGLPDSLRAAALANGADLGQEGRHVITLQRSSVEPFLQFSTRRDLRERAFLAWAARGNNGNAYDNNALIQQILALRAERAALLGFASHADYELADRMAQTPDRAVALLDEVWPRAVARAMQERDSMQAMIDAEGGGFHLQPWDWRHYAERVRLAEYNLSDAEVRPYLQLDRMIEGMFYTANRLFGLTFVENEAIPTYHPDVRAFEARSADGDVIGVYFLDPFARPSKGSGAWMNSFRVQQNFDGAVLPIIVNVLNFSRTAPGEPTLLSWDDADTLFHEFGHALHGLLSDVSYPTIAGTAVQRDYVEFPSQIYEAWLGTDEILQRFAVHAETGAPMPQELIARLRAAQTFNQGFSTVEYLASAYIDMDLHRADPANLDVAATERATLARIGMPTEIYARHRPTHFGHIFDGGYAAGYYGYLWAEVMGADAFNAFVEAGDVFDQATAERMRAYIFAAGNRRDPTEAYVLFRGRMPAIDPLLAQRGLSEAPAAD